MTSLQLSLGDLFLFGGVTVLRATLVLLGALALSFFLRGSAAARHALWTVTLGSLLALPVLSVVLPSIPVPLPLSSASFDTAPADGLTSSMSAQPEVFGLLAGTQDGGAADLRGGSVPPSSSTASSEEGPASSGFAAAIEGRRRPVATGSKFGSGQHGSAAHGFILFIWLAGWAALTGSLVVGLCRAASLCRRAVPLRDGDWARELRRARDAVRFSRGVSLRSSERVKTGMATGLLRPMVLLPGDAHGWCSERRHLVLLHELVHLKRADPLRQVCGRVALALYWFHPLVWLASREAALAREEAADEAVIALGHRPSTYARHLLDLADSSRLPIPALARVDQPQLEKRIMKILRPTTLRRSRSVLLASVLGATWALTVSAAAPADRPASQEPVAGDTLRSAPLPPPAVPAPGEIASPDVTLPEVALPGLAAPDASVPGVAAPEVAVPGIPVPALEVPPAPAPEASFEARTPGVIPAPRETPVPAEASIGLPDLPTPASLAPPVPEGQEACRPRPGGLTFEDGMDLEDARSARGERFVQRSLDDLMLCMRTQGEIVFDEGGAAIASMGPGARIMLVIRGDGVHQLMEIVPRGEQLDHAWFVDGAERPFDQAARQWRDTMLEVLGGSAEIAAIRGQEARLRGEIARTRGGEARLRGELARIRGEEARMQGEVSRTRGQDARLRGELARVAEEEVRLRSEISRIRSEEARQRAERARVSSRISALERARSASEDAETRSRLDSEVEEIRSRLGAAERQASESEVAARVAEVEQRLEAHREERVARVAEVEAELERVDVEARVREIEQRRESGARETEARIAEVEAELAAQDVAGAVRDAERRIVELEADARIREIEARVEAAEERLRALIRSMR